MSNDYIDNFRYLISALIQVIGTMIPLWVVVFMALQQHFSTCKAKVLSRLVRLGTGCRKYANRSSELSRVDGILLESVGDMDLHYRDEIDRFVLDMRADLVRRKEENDKNLAEQPEGSVYKTDYVIEAYALDLQIKKFDLTLDHYRTTLKLGNRLPQLAGFGLGLLLLTFAILAIFLLFAGGAIRSADMMLFGLEAILLSTLAIGIILYMFRSVISLATGTESYEAIGK